MDPIFMNSEHSRTSEYHVLVLKLADKLDLRRRQKLLLYQIYLFITHGKMQKAVITTTHLKYLHPVCLKNLNYQMDHIQYQIFKDYFEYILKKHSENVNNPSIKIYVNKNENRVTFKIKKAYYLELLTPGTMKLLGSTESKITKDKNGENVPHLEIVKLVLIHCNFVNNNYQQNSQILYTLIPNKVFGSLLEISPPNYIFLKIINSEFQEIKVRFTDQNSRPLEIEDKTNLTLIGK